MRLSVVLIVAAMLSSPVAVLAQETTPAAAVAPKPVKPKKTCRPRQANSVSRIAAGNICKTAAEWAVLDGTGEDPRVETGSRSVNSVGGEGR